MEKIKFEKVTILDQVKDENGNIIREGTKINAELLRRYEDTIEKLVERVNSFTK